MAILLLKDRDFKDLGVVKINDRIMLRDLISKLKKIKNLQKQSLKKRKRISKIKNLKLKQILEKIN